MELKSSLKLVFLASFALGGAAMAQTPPAEQGQAPTPPAEAAAAAVTPAAPDEATGRNKAEEEILVTGSRVRRKDLTTPAPVTVLSREQIQSSATTNIGDFLQQLPEQAGALNTNVNNGGDGETQISLRNLGSNRTLVLVDGKRMVNGGVGAGTAVDLNSIPTSAVERVEVLKDGGSAVYGSDAIGGVVNIITRKRMDGVELSAYTGSSGHNDAIVHDLSLLAGANGDRGSFMVGLGYFDQQSMFASARDWATAANKYNFVTAKEGTSGSPTLPKPRVNGFDPDTCKTLTQVCSDLFNTFGAGKQNFIYDPTKSKPGVPYADGWRIRDAAVDFFNYQAVNYLVTPSTRVSTFGNGEYRVGDSARAYLQASYVNRQSQVLVAPEPFAIQNAGITIDATNPYNPFGVPLTSAQRRLSDLPGRGAAYEVDTTHLVAGFDGTLPAMAGPLSGWYWDVFFDYGRTAGQFTINGYLNTSLAGPGFGPGFTDATGAHCGTAANPIANCTPVNLLGGPGSITPDQATQLGLYQGINYGVTQLAMAGASLSGELISLAADRPAALAIGFEHRNESGSFIYEPITVAGFNSDSANPVANTYGHFYVNEGYGELSIPVINHFPGIEDLELQTAARVFNYNTFATDATYKAGLRYSPISDITLRGTVSTGFRAPNITDLYTGQAAGNFESATDPCASLTAPTSLQGPCGPAWRNGVTVAQVNSISGGNSQLKPEKATIFTAGVVLVPRVVKGLTLTVDFYSVSMTQLISTLGTQLILNECYGVGVPQDTSKCSLITRLPATQEVNLVKDVNLNAGSLLTRGIDLGAQYSLPTDGFGRFLFRLSGTYLLTYDFTTADGTTIHGAGNYDGQGSVTASGATNFNPRVKFNAGVTYAYSDFQAFLNGRYLGSFTECAPDGGTVNGASTGPGLCYQRSADPTTKVLYPTHTVPALMTFDLALGYRLKWPGGASRLTAGVRNLLDASPPRVYDSFLTYADTAYDFVGRYFYARLDHKF
jgi:outer membrane receptor protein involved in Fe transport